MNYNELKITAESKRIMMKEVAESIGMTPTGFKRSFDDGTMSYVKVSELCRLLGITPNEFFGWPVGEGGVVASNIGGDNQQNAGLVIEVLAGQLREKDKQIAQLLKALGR